MTHKKFVFGSLGVLAIFVIGFFLGRGQPDPEQSAVFTPHEETAKRLGIAVQTAKTALKEVSEPNHPDSSSKEVVAKNLSEKIREQISQVETAQSAQGNGSSFYKGKKIQEQTALARKKVIAAAQERYRGIASEKFYFVLNQMDSLSESVENPVANPFASTQQQMEAMQTKSSEALTDAN
jgi:hypothetical protein